MLKVSNKYQVVTEIKRILAKLNEPHQRRIITLSEYLQDACDLMQTVETYCHNIIMEVRLSQFGRIPCVAFHWSIVNSYDNDTMRLIIDDNYYNYLNDETKYCLADEDGIIYARRSYIEHLESLLKLVEDA